MAQFRGSMKGQRGEASRLGSKVSGLDAHIASWSGAVRVRLWYDKNTDMDMCCVALTTHHGAGAYPERMLYRGPVSGKED